MSHNAGPLARVRQSTEEMLALTDALPPMLRVVVRFAPFNYATGGLTQRWAQAQAQGRSEADVAADWIKAMRRDARLSALQVYGPDHPQAARAL